MNEEITLEALALEMRIMLKCASKNMALIGLN
jgi:hypothetical protein